MYNALIPMATLILVGSLWRWLKPMGLDASTTRKSLTGLVYMLLLPALVLDVLWKAPLGLDSFRIILLSAVATISAVVLSTLIYRRNWLIAETRGAMIIAASWANATYLGLPVLEQTFGPEFRSIALHYDLFASTPLLLTLGVWIARQHGHGEIERGPLSEIIRVPAIWAAVIAVALNLNGVEPPDGLQKLLSLLGNSVAPLMLLALGMGLRWSSLKWGSLPALAPAITIQLMMMPFMIYWISHGVGLEGDLRAAVIIEAAMPTMVLGMVISDRFRLNTELFAAATTLSTALSLVTLPLWYSWLS